MELLVICAILGCIPASIAKGKGRNFFEWWIYGALLFIVALIHSLCIGKDYKAIEQSQPNDGLVKCPYCAEAIKPEAVKCKHCGSDVKSALNDQQSASFKPTDMPFDAFFIRGNDDFSLNRPSVDEMISRMKKASPNMHPSNVKEKYEGSVDELVNRLPSAVRQDFRNYYSSQL